MNEIIDVECKDVTELADKGTEELKIEANTLWEQMEAIGAIGMVMAAELGLKMTRPDGEPIKLLENNPIIIANPMAYEQIIGKFSN